MRILKSIATTTYLHVRVLILLSLLVATVPGRADDAAGDGSNAPPAGQMCADGQFVIGFDEQSNIVCAAVPGGVMPATRHPASGKDPVSNAAPSASSADRAAPPVPASTSESAAGVLIESESVRPVIEDIDPSSVVYGKRDVVVIIEGTGFSAETEVRFAGRTLAAEWVGPGRLRVTLPTDDLAIGSYPLTVSNGDGREHTLRRAIEVY
jgi:hypothetical protein